MVRSDKLQAFCLQIKEHISIFSGETKKKSLAYAKLNWILERMICINLSIRILRKSSGESSARTFCGLFEINQWHVVLLVAIVTLIISHCPAKAEVGNDFEEKSKALRIDAFYLAKGDACFEKGQHQNAIAARTQLIELRSAPGAVQSFAPVLDLAYVLRGMSYYELGDFSRAIEDYTQSLKLDESYPAYTLVRRAAAYRCLGEEQRALNDEARALKSDEKSARALMDILTVKQNNANTCVSRGDGYLALSMTQCAILEYSKALSCSSDNSLIYVKRGDAYFQLGRYQQAIDDYSKAIAIDPKVARVFADRSVCYNADNRHWLAAADYKRAARLDPRSPELCSQKLAGLNVKSSKSVYSLEDALYCAVKVALDTALSKELGNIFGYNENRDPVSTATTSSKSIRQKMTRVPPNPAANGIVTAKADKLLACEVELASSKLKAVDSKANWLEAIIASDSAAKKLAAAEALQENKKQNLIASARRDKETAKFELDHALARFNSHASMLKVRRLSSEALDRWKSGSDGYKYELDKALERWKHLSDKLSDLEHTKLPDPSGLLERLKRQEKIAGYRVLSTRNRYVASNIRLISMLIDQTTCLEELACSRNKQTAPVSKLFTSRDILTSKSAKALVEQSKSISGDISKLVDLKAAYQARMEVLHRQHPGISSSSEYSASKNDPETVVSNSDTRLEMTITLSELAQAIDKLADVLNNRVIAKFEVASTSSDRESSIVARTNAKLAFNELITNIKGAAIELRAATEKCSTSNGFL